MYPLVENIIFSLIKSYAVLNFSSSLSNFCKIPSLLKFGKYVTYMIQDANVNKIIMYIEKITL